MSDVPNSVSIKVIYSQYVRCHSETDAVYYISHCVQELELRQAADSVLSEVRKKQADAKRMTDVLRSLEKLRRLRKEAAAKKGAGHAPVRDRVLGGDGLLYYHYYRLSSAGSPRGYPRMHCTQSSSQPISDVSQL